MAKPINYDPLEHLKLIQSVVTRLSDNSFKVKSWAIGVVSALLALSGSKFDSGATQTIAIGCAIVFWSLDSFYVWNERRFRSLYDCVIKGQDVAPPYSLDPAGQIHVKFRRSFFSRTVWPFYVLLIAMAVVAAVVQNAKPVGASPEKLSGNPVTRSA